MLLYSKISLLSVQLYLKHEFMHFECGDQVLKLWSYSTLPQTELVFLIRSILIWACTKSDDKTSPGMSSTL